ncbi:MAG: RnfABCDGE type electron transport complex subunit D [Alistipes sp.]|nr:RnfABCDGE type electron transport complex subunit D [Alistipes sp.]
MANKLIVAPAPHVQTSQSTARIMRDVVIALMPALVVSTVVFGADVLRVTALSVAACVAFEYLIQKFMVRGAVTVTNWSAVVTGVLLAFNLPASIPWWIVVMGAFVAIAVAKMTFGGLGKNPFNPALVGRVFLLIAYPVQMTSFPLPVNGAFDALSGATPLAAVKQGIVTPGTVGAQELLLGNMPGSLGEVAALALLCGFVYLLWRRVITWHIPVTVLVTMALFAGVVTMCTTSLEGVGPDDVKIGEVAYKTGFLFGRALSSGLFHVLAGGAILGAVFMATDYSTSPMTVRGGVIFAVGIGLITMCIRLWGAYPEGMSFAILVMNACVPLINKYVKPKRFGVK